jgi:hypothetical protein
MAQILAIPEPKAEVRINEHLKVWATFVNNRLIGKWNEYYHLHIAQESGKRKCKLMGFDDPVMTYIMSR